MGAQVTIGFNTNSWSNLDDLEVGNHQMKIQ
jgi:hypothetical protein